MQSDSLLNVHDSSLDSNNESEVLRKVFTEEKKPSDGVSDRYPFTEALKRDIQPNWILYITLILLISVAWIRLIYTKFILNIFKSTVNYSTAQKLFTDPGIVQKRVSMVLHFIYLISGGLYIYLLFDSFGWYPFELSGIYLLLACSGFLAGLIILRYILLSLTGYIFRRERIFSEYLFHHFLINKVLGVVLLPFIIAIAYTQGMVNEVIIYSSFIAVSITYILRISRAIIFIFRNVISLFYLILYLCAVEILPILVVIKFLITLA